MIISLLLMGMQFINYPVNTYLITPKPTTKLLKLTYMIKLLIIIALVIIPMDFIYLTLRDVMISSTISIIISILTMGFKKSNYLTCI